MLRGPHATTNRLAFDWVVTVDPDVLWEGESRWLDAGQVVTSAGVSADIGATLHDVGRLAGREAAVVAATRMEYPWDSRDS